ncbi:hypothetical protein SRABI106_03699 [Rahnella aquatilis]|nr:hypothetical protein SRABI106_03699 [Rahnella aquatilis]
MPQSDARRCAGRNDVTGLQAHEAAEITDDFWDLENHGARIAVLPALAVNFQPQIQLVRVRDFIRRHQPRTGRAECVTAFTFVPGAAAFNLEFALRDIVDHAVTGDVRHRIGFADIAPAGADHHTEFHFPVGFDRITRDLHVVIWPDHRAGPFAENHRFFRDLRASFGGVVGVIEADTDKFPHLADTGTQTWFTADQWQRVRIELAQFIQRFRLQKFAADVGNMCAEIPQRAVVIQQAGALRTCVAVT